MTQKSQAIPFEQLVDWIEGRLTETEAQKVSQLAETADEATRANIVWIQSFQKISHQVVLAEPPAKVRRNLAARFEAFAQDRRQPSLWQRLVASLTFDSNTQFALAGARSATTQGLERQMVYSTDLADVALNVQPHLQDEQVMIMGQVLPIHEDATGIYSVQLLCDDVVELALTVTDNLGEFTFESIPPGVYDIVMSSDHFELILAPVDLRY